MVEYFLIILYENYYIGIISAFSVIDNNKVLPR